MHIKLRGTALCFPLFYILVIQISGKEDLNYQTDKKKRAIGERGMQLLSLRGRRHLQVLR